MKNIKHLELGDIRIDIDINNTFLNRKLRRLVFSLKRFGQKQAIIVVQRGKHYYIIDGVARYHAAKQINKANPEQFKTIECMVVSGIESIMEDRVAHNTFTKRTITELCKEVEFILGYLGKQQGKRRDLLEVQDWESANPGKVKKDRFDLACSMVDEDMRPATLRRLMKVYWEEEKLPEDQKTGIMKLLDAGETSINRAYELLQEKEKKAKEIDTRKRLKLGGGHNGKWFKIYNESSLNLLKVKDKSTRLCVTSPPYFQLRPYRNQGEIKHGQEKTAAEYIAMEMKFYKELHKKLVPGGVLAVIIGETYRNGYQGICTDLEVGLRNIGYRILDVIIWNKLNAKDTPHPFRFRNTYERIIVACKVGANPVFNDFKIPSSKGAFKVQRGSKRLSGRKTHTMGSPEASATNVITTSVFNTSELKKYDKDFQHDAPASVVIYDRLIQSYTRPNSDDIFIDIFAGTGTGLEVALNNGINAIGFEIDPVSADFIQKRCSKIIELQKNKAA